MACEALHRSAVVLTLVRVLGSGAGVRQCMAMADWAQVRAESCVRGICASWDA